MAPIENLTEAQLTAAVNAIDTAIIELGTNAISEYMLDTGQSKQRVVKQDIDSLLVMRNVYYTRLCALQEGGNLTYINNRFV
jgi:hypothetical protein